MSNTTKLTNEHRSAIRGAFNAILCGQTYEDRDEAAEQAWQWFEDEVLSELPSDTDADLDALDAIGDEAIAFCESLAADEDFEDEVHEIVEKHLDRLGRDADNAWPQICLELESLWCDEGLQLAKDEARIWLCELMGVELK